MLPKQTGEKYLLSSSPHAHGPRTVSSLMLDVIVALLPAFGCAIFFFGLRALLLAGTCIAACLVTEALCRIAMKRENSIGDLSAVLTGLLLALNLPPEFPDPLGGFLARDEVGKAGDAIDNGMLPVIRIVNQLRQHRETPYGKLPHDPVVCILVRAGKGVFTRHDRIHKVKPCFAHGFSKDLLHIGGADPGLKNIAALPCRPILGFRNRSFSKGHTKEGLTRKHHKSNEHSNPLNPAFSHDVIHISVVIFTDVKRDRNLFQFQCSFGSF